MLSQDNNDLRTPLLETEVDSLGHLEAHDAVVLVRGRRTNGEPLTNLQDSMIGLQKLRHSALVDTLLSYHVMMGEWIVEDGFPANVRVPRSSKPPQKAWLLDQSGPEWWSIM